MIVAQKNQTRIAAAMISSSNLTIDDNRNLCE